jgi:hypothetical protein
VPRAAVALFQVVDTLRERGHEFSIALSVLELYNEQVMGEGGWQCGAAAGPACTCPDRALIAPPLLPACSLPARCLTCCPPTA